MEVPRVVTPLAEVDAAHILVNTFMAAGIQAHQMQASLLLAQLWLETLDGQQVKNKNPGNLSVLDTGPDDYYRPAWFTIDANSSPDMKALHEKMLKHEAPSAFASFPSFEAGIAAYVNRLRTKFSAILTASATGDASAVAEAIKTSGYTPDGSVSAAALSSIATSFQRKGTFKTLPLAQGSTPVQGAAAPAFSSQLQVSQLQQQSSISPPTPVVSSDALPILQLGSSGVYVRILQRLLGIAPVTGDFDALLDDRLRIEQTILGVQSTGIVEATTWKALLQ
jgi:hypothetical protein